VFLSIGTPLHRTLNIPGEHLTGVVPALPFLRAVSAGQAPALGNHVLVIGGGDVAMDAVRSSLRLCPSRDVRLVYRRGRSEMPADPEEVRGAEHEGIRFLFQKAPVRIVGETAVTGVVVQDMELGPPDGSGRRSPVAVEGSEATLECDTVVVAVGQRADLTGMDPQLDLRIAPMGWPEGQGEGFATGVPGIFAAGGRSVVYAMGNAKKAADAIDAFLSAKRGEAAGPRPNSFGSGEPFHLPAGYTTPIRS
ncbi:MAG TPA: FAD-dependent oxidoreductase, partial [Thermoplasmata archaeon]|nr:FAD-dependent oxidoreductase [Thermoplasmata archaeon]